MASTYALGEFTPTARRAVLVTKSKKRSMMLLVIIKGCVPFSISITVMSRLGPFSFSEKAKGKT